MAAKPIKSLELHYTNMIQFLIINNIITQQSNKNKVLNELRMTDEGITIGKIDWQKFKLINMINKKKWQKEWLAKFVMVSLKLDWRINVQFPGWLRAVDIHQTNIGSTKLLYSYSFGFFISKRSTEIITWRKT